MKIEDILAECIEDVKAGRCSVEDCLAKYPSISKELEPLLRLALEIREPPEVKPSPAFRVRTRVQLMEQIHAKPAVTKWRWFRYSGQMKPIPYKRRFNMVGIIVAIVLAVSALGGGTVYASQDSLPGDALYPVKLGTEQARLVLTPNPEGKAHLLITFAAERIDEIKVVLEIKGVEAKGLDVAQSRLQAHLAKAATIVRDQKAKGKDVSSLAKELVDKFEAPKSSLAQTFKEQKHALEVREDELKAQLKAAHQAGDIAQQEAIAAELGQVMAQLELLELREEDIEDELEAEEERIEEEMEAQYKAEKAIGEAEKELAELNDEATEEGIEIPTEALAEFNNLLSQARAAFQAENYNEARRLAKQAEELLKGVEDVIEEIEEKREAKEEAEEAIQEAKQELQEVKAEAEEVGIVVPPETFGELNSLLLQAKAAFDAENYKEAERLAEQAEEALDDIEELLKN